MKLSIIIALFTFSVMVRGWVAYLQPIVLSIGAAFTALNFDAEPLLDIKFSKWLTSTKESDPTDDAHAKKERKIKEE